GDLVEVGAVRARAGRRRGAADPQPAVAGGVPGGLGAEHAGPRDLLGQPFLAGQGSRIGLVRQVLLAHSWLPGSGPGPAGGSGGPCSACGACWARGACWASPGRTTNGHGEGGAGSGRAAWGLGWAITGPGAGPVLTSSGRRRSRACSSSSISASRLAPSFMFW